MKNVIDIEDVAVGYRNRRRRVAVQKNINARLNQGELCCLLGANGTGKSTLLRTLCGFQERLAGEIFIHGRSLDKMTPQQMSRFVSVVLTGKITLNNATVYEVISYGRAPYTGFFGALSQHDRQIVHQAMEQVGILPFQSRYIHDLSDGERQKVMIAKALVQDTPVIILDEPTAFLDLPARVEMMQLLRHLAVDTGKAILMSTHDLDLALQVADRIWLMQKNSPMIIGSPEDLLMQNAFRPVFERNGVSFDNRTGLFRVLQQHEQSVKVNGHGFEYVMLRRALSRNGIAIDKCSSNDLCIEVCDRHSLPFRLFCKEEKLLDTRSVEEMVKMTKQYMKSKAVTGKNQL